MKPTIRFFSNFALSEFEQAFLKKGLERHFAEFYLFFNKSGRADFSVVLNTTSRPHFSFGPKLKTLKVLMEPEVRSSPVHFFTWKHSRTFDRVLCHNASSSDPRTVPCPPLVPPHAIKSAGLLSPPNKTRLFSAIGSSLRDLPMHVKRTAFLDGLAGTDPQVDVFGKGRVFLEDKSDGLLPYRYSIAIENTISEHYWTEKITDCFLSWTIPIYAGHPSTCNVFPPGAVVMLDPDSLVESWGLVKATLTSEDYASRLDALNEAREIIIDQFNLGDWCGRHLISLSDGHQKYWRFLIHWTWGDTVGAMARQLGKFLKLLRRP